METLNFETNIKSSAEQIWKVLWDEKTYPQWTHYFSNNSVLKSDWEIGGRTYFLDPAGDGMVSTISTLSEPYEVVFRHLGVMKGNVEVMMTKGVEEWSGMEEKYFLTERDGFINLKVIVHSPNDYHDKITTGYTRGLEKVKTLSENF